MKTRAVDRCVHPSPMAIDRWPMGITTPTDVQWVSPIVTEHWWPFVITVSVYCPLGVTALLMQQVDVGH